MKPRLSVVTESIETIGEEVQRHFREVLFRRGIKQAHVMNNSSLYNFLQLSQASSSWVMGFSLTNLPVLHTSP